MTESLIQTQVDPSTLDGFEQLHAILDGRLPAARREDPGRAGDPRVHVRHLADLRSSGR